MTKTSKRGKSLSVVVRTYVAQRTALRTCLSEGLINFSALARQICRAENIQQFQGVVVACRRFASRLNHPKEKVQNNIHVLQHAHISAINQISVAVIQRPVDPALLSQIKLKILQLRGEINIIEGRDRVTMTYSDRFTTLVESSFGSQIKKISSGLTQISIVFDERFESTSGVVAAIYNRFAMEGINIQEEMSCSSDLHLIVSEDDAPRAVKILSSWGEGGC